MIAVGVACVEGGHASSNEELEISFQCPGLPSFHVQKCLMSNRVVVAKAAAAKEDSEDEEEEEEDDEDDSCSIMSSSVVSTLDPITRKPMKDPGRRRTRTYHSSRQEENFDLC